MTATIERREPGEEFILSSPGKPGVVSKERVALPCGCCAYPGLRIDTLEVSLVATECSPEHRTLRDRFYDLMEESLRNPSASELLLIEVAKELLEKVENEFQGGVL